MLSHESIRVITIDAVPKILLFDIYVSLLPFRNYLSRQSIFCSWFLMVSFILFTWSKSISQTTESDAVSNCNIKSLFSIFSSSINPQNSDLSINALCCWILWIICCILFSIVLIFIFLLQEPSCCCSAHWFHFVPKQNNPNVASTFLLNHVPPTYVKSTADTFGCMTQNSFVSQVCNQSNLWNFWRKFSLLHCSHHHC